MRVLFGFRRHFIEKEAQAEPSAVVKRNPASQYHLYEKLTAYFVCVVWECEILFGAGVMKREPSRRLITLKQERNAKYVS